MRWRRSSESCRDAGVPDQDVVLAAALDHAGTQLLAQIVDESGLDGRLIGVLGFNGALVAADVAAQAILGRWWWMPLPFIACASILCFRSIFGKDTSLGPETLDFYAAYGGQDGRAGREQLLVDLDAAFRANAKRAAEKARILKAALVLLSAGALVAGPLMVWDTPSRVRLHVCRTADAATCAAKTSSGSKAIRAAAGGASRAH